MSINAEEQAVDLNRRLCTDVKDLCGSLIDVLPGDRVQLVHGTAKKLVNLFTLFVSCQTLSLRYKFSGNSDRRSHFCPNRILEM